MTEGETYGVLDSGVQLNLIRSRIRELESNQLTLELRINAPSPTDEITDRDYEHLEQVRQSLEYLRNRESELEARHDPPASSKQTGGAS